VKDAWVAGDVAVGEASDGSVEADGDGAVVDLVDGFGSALEIAGGDVSVDSDAVAHGQALQGAVCRVGGDGAVPVVDCFTQCGYCPGTDRSPGRWLVTTLRARATVSGRLRSEEVSHRSATTSKRTAASRGSIHEPRRRSVSVAASQALASARASKVLVRCRPARSR